MQVRDRMREESLNCSSKRPFQKCFSETAQKTGLNTGPEAEGVSLRARFATATSSREIVDRCWASPSHSQQLGAQGRAEADAQSEKKHSNSTSTRIRSHRISRFSAARSSSCAPPPWILPRHGFRSACSAVVLLGHDKLG